MAKIQLVDLAHARSGDKGDTANVGVVAYDPGDWELLREALTADRVKAHFGPMVKGRVERFELPNLRALNFLLHGALGGGGTVSLMTDAQGKVFSTALLRMELEVPDEVAERARGRGRVPSGFDPRAPVPGADSGAAGSAAAGSGS
jgi:hypothetical protein